MGCIPSAPGFARIMVMMGCCLSPPADDAMAAPAGPGYAMEYGAFQSYTISLPQDPVSGEFSNLVTKAVTIRLGHEAAICFDTELLRVAMAWTGRWLDRSRTHLTSSKGELHVRVAGDVHVQTAALPGWKVGAASWEDPRPRKVGSLPRSWGRYGGLYRHGEEVVLEYRLGERRTLDHPYVVMHQGSAFFCRDIRLAAGAEPLEVLLAGWDHMIKGPVARPIRGHAGGTLRVQVSDGADRIAAWSSLPGGRGLEARFVLSETGRLSLALPPLTEDRTLRVLVGVLTNAEEEEEPVVKDWLKRPEPDWEGWTSGGPAQWTDLPPMKGRVAPSRDAYVVDALPVPLDNPWQSWMRLVGMDFFSDGRAAVSTWNGDVWIVSGIDAGLEAVRWRRFASGLFEGLGVRIVDDVVHVLERHQITRLHDLNGDGEADYYECFNNDAPIGPSYHAFSFGLETDAEGHFYFTRCGHRVDPGLPLNGGVIRVRSDGSAAHQWATGMRAPNGMGMGADGRLTTSDNQGNWVPTSRVDMIRQGGFYGYLPHAGRTPPPTNYEPPLCWIPYALDNSSGGQVWVETGSWGPLSGHLLHTSYGKGGLFDLVLDPESNPPQALVVPFGLRFDSGIMRGRIHPRDGQVYLCGLKGWQTTGVRDGGLYRVRYTGQPLHQVTGWQVLAEAVLLRFDVALDPASACDPDNYAAEQWSYVWSEAYGSPEYSVVDPTRQGRDRLEVTKVELVEDGRGVKIGLPGLQPVMQIRLRVRCATLDGGRVDQDVYGTIHRVPAPGSERE